jgi:hypothetical protein
LLILEYTEHGKKIHTRKAWLYLYHRSITLLDANPRLPDIVNDLMAWLATELDLANKTREADVREIVCKTIVNANDARGPGVYRELNKRNRPARTPGINLCTWDKLAISVVLDNTRLVEKLLPECMTEADLGNPLGDMLQHAARAGEVHFLDLISKNVQSLEQPNKAIFGKRYAGELFTGPLFRAIKAQDTVVLDKLLLLHSQWRSKFIQKEIWDRWMEYAVWRGSVEVLRRFQNIEFSGDGPRVERRAFETACKGVMDDKHYTDPCILNIKELLQSGVLDPNQIWHHTTPLKVAIEYGDMAAVKAVIDAGANVNDFRWPDPLKMAEHKPNMKALLVRSGALQRGSAAWKEHHLTQMTASSHGTI